MYEVSFINQSFRKQGVLEIPRILQLRQKTWKLRKKKKNLEF